MPTAWAVPKPGDIDSSPTLRPDYRHATLRVGELEVAIGEAQELFGVALTKKTFCQAGHTLAELAPRLQIAGKHLVCTGT